MFHSIAVPALYLGGAISFVAALMHYACIFLGAPALRFMGAGEALARMSERGHWYPPFISFLIGSVLLAWAAYALAGAGVFRSLPLTKYALAAISAVYLARAIAFPLLKPAFPGNSEVFWWVSSGVCLLAGVSYLAGTAGLWRRL